MVLKTGSASQFTEEAGLATGGVAGGGGAGSGGVAGQPGVTSLYDRDWIANACARAPGPLHQLTTSDPAVPAITGRWARCGSTGLFGLDWPGVAITATNFNFLAWDNGQTLVSEQGTDANGPFTYALYPARPVEALFTLTYPDNTQVRFDTISMNVSLSAGAPQQIVFDSTTNGEHDRYVALMDPIGLGGGGGVVGVAGAGGGGAAGGGGGAGGTAGAGGSAPIPCQTNADCPRSNVCFFAAPATPFTTCTAATGGQCLPILNMGNCTVAGSPCQCLTNYLGYSPCASSPGLECNGSSGGYYADYTSPISCFGCFPPSSQQ